MIGDAPTMQRHNVDDDANVGCSYGFHVGSLEYVRDFASGNDRIVIVEVSPADIVSVPHDCAHMKVRVCRYKVVAEYTGPLPEVASVSADRPYESLGDAELPEDDPDTELPWDNDVENPDGEDVKVYTQAEFDEAVRYASMSR